jgi:carboxyl-terminal processing protease
MSVRISGVIQAFVCVVAIALCGPASWAQSPDRVSLAERVVIATKIYHQISTYFPDLQRKEFDQTYETYINAVLSGSDDRREFDLATMALVASLHDGHTWFYDNWLGKTYGQAAGFTVYPLAGKWVVMQSQLASVKKGDIIEAIDGTPTQQYFERSKKYISASSDRDAGISLFDTPALLPLRFNMTLDGGRQVAVDRARDKKEVVVLETEGRWLVPGKVAYIRVPIFHGIETQAAALQYLKQFKDATAVILDVRGNQGGGSGAPLESSLMEKAYPMWSESSSMQGGMILRGYDMGPMTSPEMTHVTSSEGTLRPGAVYTGKLLLLTDRGCTCACEDFVMAFKVTKRAELVGETTAGTFSFTSHTQFENGMITNISAVRHTFPDGSRFEGVGIAPDVEVQVTAQDLKSGKDVVLEKALELAGKN